MAGKYGKQLGFTDEEIEQWQDTSRFIKGKNKIGVVLVHGWSALPKQLDHLSEYLQRQGYWVSVPLLAGHGTWPEGLEGVKWERWLDDVIEAVRALKAEPEIKQVFVGGTSLGGNLALLASLEEEIAGVFLIGAPVHIKKHFWIWLGAKIVPLFKKYLRKKYSRKVDARKLRATSYQYFPTKSVKESLAAIKTSVKKLGQVTAPLLVLQTQGDYLITKYSPWIIYNKVQSRFKKLQWIQAQNNSHSLLTEENEDAFVMIDNFIQEVVRQLKSRAKGEAACGKD